MAWIQYLITQGHEMHFPVYAAVGRVETATVSTTRVPPLPDPEGSGASISPSCTAPLPCVGASCEGMHWAGVVGRLHVCVCKCDDQAKQVSATEPPTATVGNALLRRRHPPALPSGAVAWAVRAQHTGEYLAHSHSPSRCNNPRGLAMVRVGAGKYVTEI